MAAILSWPWFVNALRPEQDGHYFADNIQIPILAKNMLCILIFSLWFFTS